jgi:hypothetical protein
MKTVKKNVKMNLSLDEEFYELLQDRAKHDYVRVSTWTRQYLMKCLLEKNNMEVDNLNKNGRFNMGL